MFVPATKTVRTATTRAGPSSGTIPPPVLAVVLVRELRLAASQAQPQSVKGDQPSMTTLQWFTCMFSYNFNFEVLQRLWDIIFLKGTKIMFRIF